MKFDKESIVKNRFWILLGTAAFLTLVGWLLLIFTVPATVGDERTKVQKNWSARKNVSNFKHPEYATQMKEEANRLKAALSSLHGEMYKAQAEQSFMMSWPKAMVEQGFDFRNGKFAKEATVHKLDPKGADKLLKSRPADTDSQMSGIIIGGDEDKFSMKDRRGNVVQFMRWGNVYKFGPNTKVTLPEQNDPKNPPPFGALANRPQHVVDVKYVNGKFFGDDLTDSETRLFRDSYKDQLAETLAELGPLNYVKEPQVLLRYILYQGSRNNNTDTRKQLSGDIWNYRPDKLPPDDSRFFSYISNWKDSINDISAEEVWAAQENLWVQREIYKQLRSVNEAVARFERDKKDEKDGWAKFHNHYWEIELKVMENGPDAKVAAKLRNRRPDPQSLNNLRFVLHFRDPNDKDKFAAPVLFPPKEPRDLRFEGSTVEPSGSGNDRFPAKDYAEFPVAGPLTELVAVDQVLTVQTAAIKRLDVLTVALSPITGETAVGHRQAGKQAALLSFKKKIVPKNIGLPDKKAEDLFKQNDAAGAKNPTTPPPDDIDPNAPELANLDVKADLKLSPNNLVLDRYIDKTTEFRRLPISIVAIIDPEQLNRVEAALASSPLRFLTTQVLWQRATIAVGIAPPSAASAAAPKAGFASPGPTPATSGETQENIEVAIYGLITLYDRPGRPDDGFGTKK